MPRLAIALVQLGVALLGATACASRSARADAREVSFMTLEQGARSGIRERAFLVVKTSQDFEALWRRHRGGDVRPPAPPPIDFQKDMVVAVFAGDKPTGGHRIEITRIETRGQRGLVVHVAEAAPPPGALVTQALTQPYHIVTLPKVDGPVEFAPVGTR